MGLHSAADKGPASETTVPAPGALQEVWLQVLVPPCCVTFLTV